MAIFEHAFWQFLFVIFYSFNVFDFLNSYWEEKKKLKNLIYLQVCPKIGIFCPKMSQKASRGQLGSPGMTKNIFLGCQDMKTPL